MSTLFEDLEKRARTLSREEKAALARVLIDELDPIQDPGDERRGRYDCIAVSVQIQSGT